MTTKQIRITYQTPVGTFTNVEEAEAACARCDFDFAAVVVVIREEV